jgi:hypothetical protein
MHSEIWQLRWREKTADGKKIYRLLLQLCRRVDQRALRKGLEEVVHGGLSRADVA